MAVALRKGRGLSKIFTAGLFAAACSEAVSPARAPSSPDAPLFSFSPSGITLDKHILAFNQRGRLLVKGFDPISPSNGDAVIATFYWLGSTNIIDSVVDVMTTNPFTRVGNTYHLVSYVMADGLSMATYVATNVRGIPNGASHPNPVYAVGAYLRDSVADGGIRLTAWTGVADVFAQALGHGAGAPRSALGTGTGLTVASAGPIAVNAGALVYGVTVGKPPVGLDRDPAFAGVSASGSDAFMKDGAEYTVRANGGTADPRWTWHFDQQQGVGRWLATTLTLNAAPPPPGSLTVTTSTTGSGPDPDGFTVTLDDATSQPIPSNGTVTFAGIAAGSHSVSLSGIATNCTVSGPNPQAVSVPAAGTGTMAFAVSCSALVRESGALNQRGRLLAKGFSPNPERGDVVVATFFWLGSTNIIDSVTDALSDAAATQVGNTYALVEYVTAGGISMATYVATNVQNFSDTSTTPGQTLVVRAHLADSVADGGTRISAWRGVAASQAVGAHRFAAGNGTSTTVATAGSIAISAGAIAYAVTMSDGLVWLSRPAGFTGVGRSQSDAVLKQDAAYLVSSGSGSVDPQWTWGFNSPGSPKTWLATVLALHPVGTGGSSPGKLTVTTSTTGGNPDPDGYTVALAGVGSQPIANAGSVTFTDVAARSQTVSLSGLAANCAVSGGPNTRTVTVPPGGSATVAFAVSCSASNTGDVVVTASTTGSNVDPDGYTVTLDDVSSQPITNNGQVVFAGVAAGDHSVRLSGNAANCTISAPNPRTVTAPAGGTVGAAWVVNCTAPPPPGIGLVRQTGAVGMQGRLLANGFNPNPHRGDAIVATFFWVGSTNVVDSVTDALGDAASTRVGNSYTLVEFVTAGGISMATYVAANVQNFADTSTTPGQALVVRAHLADSVSNGGAKISAWRGVDPSPHAVGAHHSAAGSGTSSTVASAGPMAVNVGALAYAVTMSDALVGLGRPSDFTGIGQSQSNAVMKQDAVYVVSAGGGSVEPLWTWFFNSPGSPKTWLATVLELRPQ